MIRFDEVPINRRVKKLKTGARTKYDFYTKVSIVIYWDTKIDDSIECNSIDDDGYPHFIKDAEMVELVDKCANCKRYDRKTNNCCELGRPVKHDGEYNTHSLNRDPETFKCSEWRQKE